VLGASFDPPSDNKTFADTESFGFRLLSDVDRAVGTAYGVLRPDDDPYASMPKRVSFLIDPDGVIRRTYEVKDTAAHADEVLADLDALRSA